MSVRKERIFLKIENKLYNFISYKERRKKALLTFEKKVNQYSSISDTEFLMDYVNISAKHERKKAILLFSVPPIIIMLFGIGNSVIKVFTKLASFENYVVVIDEKAKAFFGLTLFIAMMAFALGIFFIVIFINQFYALTKEKKIMEEIKSIRK